MLDDLKRNVEQEKRIVEDMKVIRNTMESDASNQNFYLSSLNALSHQLKLLNKAVPNLLKEIAPLKKAGESRGKFVKMSYVSPSTKEKRYVTIDKKDKKEFLEKLKFSEGGLLGLKKMKKASSRDFVYKPSYFARISNKFFRKGSEKLVPKFSSLEQDLKRANVRFLTSTYLSMAIMTSVIGFVFGVLFFAVLMILNLGNWVYFWLPFGFLGLVLVGFYFYPASQASSIQKKISQELPFATIHMAAIAGSNIEPTKIFKIIASSKEYSHVGAEMRKVITQVDIYGYDLVTSLKNVAKRTSNKRLAELFSGLATNIGTGGGLKTYLESKAENFLLDYRLERQKYSELAGTFMDVYISILIAAPLVLMMMFIVMNVAGLGFSGFGIDLLLVLSVAGVVILNVILDALDWDGYWVSGACGFGDFLCRF